MRVISGEYGGRVFRPPADKWPTRPTTDISKEGLFNILQNLISFDQVDFLDLFGGTGSHCYEMISRGCVSVDYVDRHRPAVNYVKSISEEWGFDDRITIHSMDVFKYIKTCTRRYDYIFAGPPYPLKRIPEIPELIFKHQLLATDGLFILEHNQDHDFGSDERFWQLRKYGGTYFSFFQH